ncbi:uncharacterized protein LOC129234235 [Uloborus diversus]|uniref:uncharacterized protein LOC129234235 n=1 Tax=Uloborus diversus TaxID=327109 RepID=UPI002409E908|nr:uncharacterized protein LOC129234235 [Uloborus diversus]
MDWDPDEPIEMWSCTKEYSGHTHHVVTFDSLRVPDIQMDELDMKKLELNVGKTLETEHERIRREENDEVRNEAAERKNEYKSEVQCCPQMTALKVENSIPGGDVKALVKVRHSPLDRQATEREVSMKIEYESDCKEEKNDEVRTAAAERNGDYIGEVQSYLQMKSLKVENSIATVGVNGIVNVRHWTLERQADEREISKKNRTRKRLQRRRI